MIVNRDTIILVYYLNLDEIATEEERLHYINIVKSSIHTDGCFQVIIPVFNQDSRIECVNPKYMSIEEYSRIEEKIKELEINLDKTLESYKNKRLY